MRRGLHRASITATADPKTGSMLPSFRSHWTDAGVRKLENRYGVPHTIFCKYQLEHLSGMYYLVNSCQAGVQSQYFRRGKQPWESFIADRGFHLCTTTRTVQDREKSPLGTGQPQSGHHDFESGIQTRTTARQVSSQFSVSRWLRPTLSSKQPW